MTHPLEQLISEEHLDHFVRECAQMVRDEVAQKRGVSGVMIKAGFKLIERVRPSIIDDLLYSLLPLFIERLKPFYDAYLAHSVGGGDLGAYLIARATEVASGLLEVTDERAEKSRMSALVSAYRKLRPIAQDQIISAMPRLGALLERHLARHR